MNKDFVTYELAVKLKEKGFDWQTFDWYDMAGNFCKGFMPRELMCREYYAPTISQVLKWLREEKKIYIVIAVNPTLSTKDKIAYYYQVYSNSNGVTSDYYESEECYTQWEDCALDSIKYVLDNLI